MTASLFDVWAENDSLREERERLVDLLERFQDRNIALAIELQQALEDVDRLQLALLRYAQNA